MIESSASIGEIVSGFFNCFDNRDCTIPDFSQFSQYFVEGSTIGKRTTEGVTIWSLQSFWQPRSELLKDGRLIEFHEWETESETTINKELATHYSSYQKEGLLDGLPYHGVGTKLFQLAKTPKGWRIVFVLWEDLE